LSPGIVNYLPSSFHFRLDAFPLVLLIEKGGVPRYGLVFVPDRRDRCHTRGHSRIVLVSLFFLL